MRTVYVGSVLQVILHLADRADDPGVDRRTPAWATRSVPGDSVVAHFPREALRVLPEGGTAVLEEAELDVSLEEA